VNPSKKLKKLIEGLEFTPESTTTSPFPVGNGFEWRPKSPKDREFCDQVKVCGSGAAEVMFGLFGPNNKVHGIAAVDASGTLTELTGRGNMPFSPKYYGYFVKWAAGDPRIKNVDPRGYKNGGMEAAQAAYNAAEQSDPSSFRKLTPKIHSSSRPDDFENDDHYGSLF
jgi:hypothetical protein